MTRLMPLALASSLIVVMACGETDSTIAPANLPEDVVENPGADAPDQPADEPESPREPRQITEDEKEALNNALQGLPFGVDLQGISDVGTILLTFNGPAPTPPNTTTTTTTAPTSTALDGVAIQTASGVSTSGTPVLEFTILVAWDGLDETNQTVDELFLVFAPFLVDAGTANLGPVTDVFDDAWSIYADVANSMTYYSEQGEFVIDTVTLDPATEVDCSGAGFTCTQIEGTLEGELDMTAIGFTSTGTVITNSNVPTGPGTTLDVTAEFDVPVGRTTISE